MIRFVGSSIYKHWTFGYNYSIDDFDELSIYSNTMDIFKSNKYIHIIFIIDSGCDELGSQRDSQPSQLPAYAIYQLKTKNELMASNFSILGPPIVITSDEIDSLGEIDLNLDAIVSKSSIGALNLELYDCEPFSSLKLLTLAGVLNDEDFQARLELAYQRVALTCKHSLYCCERIVYARALNVLSYEQLIGLFGALAQRRVSNCKYDWFYERYVYDKRANDCLPLGLGNSCAILTSSSSPQNQHSTNGKTSQNKQAKSTKYTYANNYAEANNVYREQLSNIYWLYTKCAEFSYTWFPFEVFAICAFKWTYKLLCYDNLNERLALIDNLRKHIALKREFEFCLATDLNERTKEFVFKSKVCCQVYSDLCRYSMKFDPITELQVRIELRRFINELYPPTKVHYEVQSNSLAVIVRQPLQRGLRYQV